jgi:hypothetical protein
MMERNRLYETYAIVEDIADRLTKHLIDEPPGVLHDVPLAQMQALLDGIAVAVTWRLRNGRQP